MERLPSPFEILELGDGEKFELRVERWEQGLTTIRPSYAPEGKDIQVLRIHVPQGNKPFFPFYWDITASTLVAQLLPYLEKPNFKQRTFRVRKHGVAPRARFTLEVV